MKYPVHIFCSKPSGTEQMLAKGNDLDELQDTDIKITNHKHYKE